MTCAEARELIGADPETDTPELLAHLASCPECQVYRQQMIALNAKIRRAMELDPRKLKTPGAPITPIAAASGASQQASRSGATAASSPDASQPVSQTTIGAASGPGTPPPASHASAPGAAPPPASRASAPGTAPPPAGPSAPPPRSNVTAFPRRTPAPVPKHKRPRLFAFAASLAAALVVGFTLWLSRPAESLAAEIVAHVEGEPNSWSKTQPVTAEHLENVLRKSGVRLGPGMQPVVYASSCWFRGHFVPHFVVTTKDGPVTVMILANEQVQAQEQFKEAGFTGLVVPARNGSVAVISRTPMALEQPAREVVTALQSANQAPDGF